MPDTDTAPTTKTRRKLLGTLFASVGISRTGFLAAATVTALVAHDTLDSATWAGLPGAVAIIGVAVGTTPTSLFMARFGRRPGMVVGQTIAASGALLAAAAVGLTSFALLLVALFVLGFGNSADRLARYAAADVSEPNRRGSAIAFIVWAGTIGAVVGPALLEPSQAGAERLGLAGLVGPYLLAAGSFAVAGLVVYALLRPDPLTFAPDERLHVGTVGIPLSVPFAVPAVRIALVALVVGQVVMVLIMTMTPIHIRDAGQSLGAVGLVISAHTLGMFALSPLTGWLIDRLGRIPVIVAGQVLFIVSGIMAVFASGDDRALLVTALFLLGLGWNFGFVAGSALVVEGVAPAERLRMQGITDGFVWTSAAAASLFSGFVLAVGGYPAVGLVGAALAIIPLTVVVLQARQV